MDDSPFPLHRKPGGIRADDPHWGHGYNAVMYPDVWSGNSDTDKAWRDRLPGLDHLPWS